MAPSADAGESQHGSVFSVSGPVVVAEHMIGCAMYELVCFHVFLRRYILRF